MTTETEVTVDSTLPKGLILTGIRHIGMERVGADQIRADAKWNVRSDVRDIPALAEDMRLRGIMTPLIVTVAKTPGTYRLIAGFRRYAALAEIATSQRPGIVDMTSIPVNVIEGGEADLLLLNMAENEARRNLTPYEVGHRCLRLRKEFGLSAPQIAAQIPGGQDPGTLNNNARLAEKLDAFWQSRWQDGSAKWRDLKGLIVGSAAECRTAQEAAREAIEKEAAAPAPATATSPKPARAKAREDITAVLGYFSVCPRSGDTAPAARVRGVIEALRWVLGSGKIDGVSRPAPGAPIAKLMAVGGGAPVKGRKSAPKKEVATRAVSRGKKGAK